MNPSDAEQNHSLRAESSQAGSNQNLNKALSGGVDIGEGSSLAKVREILFGNQMRELEKRFIRLEERLARECGELREETRKRLDSLETYVKNEVESLTERIKSEQGERGEVLKALAEDNRKITTSLEKRLLQFEEQTNSNQRETREQILNQSKSLQDDIRQKYEEIIALLQRETQEIRIEKTDRSTLATLLSELAIRLNSQY
ncbi:hypothetical protein NUACC21_23310 [Scytonema sp. NUACC21]